MNLSDVCELVRSTERGLFETVYDHLFLLRNEPVVPPSQGFWTEVAGPRPPGGADYELVALVKAERSPYLDRILIGRARNCDVMLRAGSVSKAHAFLHRSPASWMLTDMDSHNGTRVDDQRLSPRVATPVSTGQSVSFGAFEARLLDAGAVHALVSRLLSSPRLRT
jgi:hypothetical protein